ncbi:MAG: sigma-54 dependent transcriptional regulator [Bacteroidales bacterium]|jgi:transcriptional regulator with PAS, ATPase and Fis domain|nr:sigma-54 dependent transcriptional regulator [Bacteroidales bacterium]
MDIQTIKARFGIIGNDPTLNKILQVAMQVAVTDMNVLVTGESGVGKEVFSKIIHQTSPRKHNKYIAVNCGAIPEGTIESELFGHVKGSFTNADRDRKGYFAEADQGTIFLDEVGELPLSMQAKLLRVLEQGEFIPVGSSRSMKVDVRVISATNVNLLDAIRKGRFREDLYYRLNQINLCVPPLRERKDDIFLLFRRFALDHAEKYRMPSLSLSPQAKQYLINYTWQGNIRQLKNITEQMSIIETKREIDLPTLQSYIPLVDSYSLIVNDNFSDEQQDEILLTIIENKRQINKLASEVAQLKEIVKGLIASTNTTPLLLPKPEVQYNEPVEDPADMELNLAKMERQAIVKALQIAEGNRKEAAVKLGISERTLYRKLSDYQLDK